MLSKLIMERAYIYIVTGQIRISVQKRVDSTRGFFAMTKILYETYGWRFTKRTQ